MSSRGGEKRSAGEGYDAAGRYETEAEAAGRYETEVEVEAAGR